MPGPGIEPPTSGMPSGCDNHYTTAPLYIFKDGKHELNDDREIVNRFNAFFTNIGPDRSRNIRYNGNKTQQTYLTQTNDIEFNFTDVNDDIILNIINKLPNKNSCGYK